MAKRSLGFVSTAMWAIALNVVANWLSEPAREDLGRVGDVLGWEWLPYSSFATLLVIWAALFWWLPTSPRSKDRRPASAKATPHSATAPKVDQIKLSIEPLHYGPEYWVHVRVKNLGSPDKFIAQVVQFSNLEETDQKQYRVKWRETVDPEQTIYDEELLDFAVIVNPQVVTQSNATPEPSHPPQLNLPGIGGIYLLGKIGGFHRGKFRLFSVATPDGWDVHGRLNDISHILTPSSVPIEERPLLAFDESIRLRLKVQGSRKQEATVWIRLGFQRPGKNYDSGNYVLKEPVAEIE